MKRVGLAIAAALATVVTAQAQAATFTVGNVNDTTTACGTFPNGCSLRQLIASVPGGSTISVPDTLGTYVLTQGELLITKNLVIAGAGARTTMVEQNPPISSPTARVFDIQRDPASGIAPTVTISGLDIFFGKADSTTINGDAGGNILNEGTLTLSDDQITNGQTTGGEGGGVANVGGTLTITHSLIEDNLGFANANGAGGAAAGVDNFASRSTTANLTIDNSTIASNTAATNGGGIWSHCTLCTSITTTITNSTIVGNDGGTPAGNAGGMLAGPSSTVSVSNSIVASNTASSHATASNCAAVSPGGAVSSLGHNLETATDCGFKSTGDLQNTNPGFLTGGVNDFGGNTDVIALAANSPAVDAIPANAAGCSGTDQRGIGRPQGSSCDIGAYELVEPVEGQQFSEVVGRIDNTTASIDWGDGTPQSAGSVDPTTREVTGTHTYADEGIYHGTLHWINSDGSPSTSSFDVKVGEAALSAHGAGVNAIAGHAFIGQVATFTEANPLAIAADFVATINWGDGTPASAGTVSPALGVFVVSGTHTYAKAGSYTTTTSIVDPGGSIASTQATATVSAPPTPVTTGPPSAKRSTSASFAGSVDPDGAPTTAHFEYGLDARYTKPGASGPIYDHSTPDLIVGSDFSSHSVTASVSGLVPNALYHVRLVATNAAGTTNGPDMTFRTDRGPVPGAPGLGKTFNVSSTGLVLIEVHGVFIPLTELTKIPNGTIINALHGTLSLTTALPAVQHAAIAAKKKAKKPKTKTQKGKFSGGVFKVTQARSGLATLALVEGAKFKGAPTYASCKTKKGKAVTAALSAKTLQLLHGSAHGKFRTKGRYAAATVRGTIWTIADRCDGTLTHAIKDTVTVSDFVRHKTISLRPGHSYLALAKPPHKPK